MKNKLGFIGSAAILILAAFAALHVPNAQAQIKLPNPATNGNRYIGSNVRRYDVVMQYGASGSKTTTTVTASSGATSATVGSCTTFYKGQGFYIVGAGSAGAIFVDVVVSCTGTTLTWITATGTSVTGAIVGHEDHVAINNAVADAMNNGGGEVFFPSGITDGIYNCFVLNSVTGGCITFPQNLHYLNPVNVSLRGESLGLLDQTDDLSVEYGAAIDCHLAPNVASIGSAAATACVSPAPYLVTTVDNYLTAFNAVSVTVDNLLFYLPNQTKLTGLLFSNTLQAKIGDAVYVISKPDSANTWSSPTGSSQGIFMPQYTNNVILKIGTVVIGGFGIGIMAGEHTTMDKPYIANTNYCVGFVTAQHPIIGAFGCEQSIHRIVNNSSTKVKVSLVIDAEVTDAASCSCWWQRGTDVIGSANLYGNISYDLLGVPDAVDETMTFDSTVNVVPCNLGVAPTAGVCTP